ncbi:MAG: hypothetical protein EXR92_01575 [Gemmatimonadetes bacterium]|nr:hypothetical protein [Gemmatimonadota bacterium]
MLGGRFSGAFFFSIQTFATIGYGQIAPNGLPANLLVTLEALVGLMYQALATGLLFARFARPTASILFNHSAVVAPYHDGHGLQFRIVNRRRRNEIIELEAQILFSAMEPDGRGGTVRRYAPLSLERNKVTFFRSPGRIVHRSTTRAHLPVRQPESWSEQRQKSSFFFRGSTKPSSRPCTRALPIERMKSSGMHDSDPCSCRSAHGLVSRSTSVGCTRSSQ